MKPFSTLIATAATLAAFTLSAAAAQNPVPLGKAGDFTILAKTGISTTGVTSIIGDIGVSPIDSTGITDFALSVDASNAFATSPYVTGNVYASDFAVPTPALLTTAVANMENAYTNAAGRSLPDSTELGAGNLSGLSIAPGLHKWGTSVLVTSSVTFEGSSSAVWVLQISEDLILSNGASVQLSGGASASNIFWQVAGSATLGTGSHFEGILMSQTGIHAQTGASVNGRLLAQSAVTLDANTVTAPSLTYLAWFGNYYDAHFNYATGEGWVAHTEHGWLYLLATAQDIWFWDDIRQGWFWTSESAYPWLYSATRMNWDAYSPGGSTSLRWFYLLDHEGGHWSPAQG